MIAVTAHQLHVYLDTWRHQHQQHLIAAPDCFVQVRHLVTQPCVQRLYCLAWAPHQLCQRQACHHPHVSGMVKGTGYSP